MQFFRRHSVVFPLVVPSSSVFAFPLSHISTVAPTRKTYVPLIAVFISLFFVLLVFLVVKLVYMKHRRIGTIHAPLGVVRSTSVSSSISSLGFRDKQGNRHRGLWVGCLGSPAWETSITSKLDEATRREPEQRTSFVYRPQSTTGSTIRSTTHSASWCTESKHSSLGSFPAKSTVLTGCTGNADQLVLLCSSGSPTLHGSNFSKPLGLVARNTSTKRHSRYDFGESHDVRLPGGSVPKATRRASPSSIRLVDGLSHSNQVEYSFLSGLPHDPIVVSPLMGARDSFQLSRCSLKSHRKPAPPLPTLPSFLPFYLPEGFETRGLQATEYLPPLHFSPLASVVKVFHSPQQVLAASSRVPAFPASSRALHASNAGPLSSSSGVLDTATFYPIRWPNVKSNRKRSQSCKGLAIDVPSPRTTLNTDATTPASSFLTLEDKTCENESIPKGVLRSPSASSRNSSTISKKPLKSCLRQNSMPMVCSPESTLTPSMSEASIRTCTLGIGDQAFLRTPVSDIDIGMLGLDRFRWNDEVKVRSCHTKKDSIALVPRVISFV